MRTQVARWGNSLGVRLPKPIAEDAGIAEGDAVHISAQDGAILIRPAGRRYSLEELVGRITRGNRHTATGWGVPRGRETW